MEKSNSYFDWERKFEKKSGVSRNDDGQNLDSLGVPKGAFKLFLKNWMDKNFPKG